MLAAGGSAGAILAAPTSDYLGRKWSVFTWGLVFVLGAALQMVPIFKVLLAGRFIGGLGVGACSMLSPQFLSENAPRSVRGSMVSTGLFSTHHAPTHKDAGLHVQPLHYSWPDDCL